MRRWNAAWAETAKFPGIAAYYNDVAPSGNAVAVPLHLKPEYVRDIEGGARFSARGLVVALNGYRENLANTFKTPFGDFGIFGNVSENRAFFTSTFPVANPAGTAAEEPIAFFWSIAVNF